MQRATRAIQGGDARLDTLHNVPRAVNAPTSCDQCAADDLILRVRLCLDRANVWALRDVNIRVDGDRVILAGKVGTYYQKQLATELTRRVAEVIGIDNLIDVPSYPSPGQTPFLGIFKADPKTTSDECERRDNQDGHFRGTGEQ